MLLIIVLFVTAVCFVVSIYFSRQAGPIKLEWLKFMAYSLAGLTVCGLILMEELPQDNNLKIATAVIFVLALSFAWSYQLNIKKYFNKKD